MTEEQKIALVKRAVTQVFCDTLAYTLHGDVEVEAKEGLYYASVKLSFGKGAAKVRLDDEDIGPLAARASVQVTAIGRSYPMTWYEIDFPADPVL